MASDARGTRVSTCSCWQVRYFSSSLLLCLSFLLNRTGSLRDAYHFNPLVLVITATHRLTFLVRYKRSNSARHPRPLYLMLMYDTHRRPVWVSPHLQLQIGTPDQKLHNAKLVCVWAVWRCADHSPNVHIDLDIQGKLPSGDPWMRRACITHLGW